MRKMLSKSGMLILGAMLALSLTACGKKADGTADLSADKKTETVEQVSEAKTSEVEAAETAIAETEIEETKEDNSALDFVNEVAGYAYQCIAMESVLKFEDAEFICEMNLEEGTWELKDVSDLKEYEEPKVAKMIESVLQKCQEREYENGGAADGNMLIRYEYGSIHYVQYREEEQDTEIGQYPDAALVSDGHIQWGKFHNQRSCEICGSVNE